MQIYNNEIVYLQYIPGKAVLLFGKSIDKLNHNDFVNKFQMPSTFNSWFLITEIHVWMLMVRAMAERDHGQIIRNGIVEAMWTDALTRSKAMALQWVACD